MFRSVLPSSWRLAPLVVASLGLGGCSPSALPDPRGVAERYAAAVERGDTDGVYQLLTRDAQESYGREGTARLVKESQKELSQNARDIAREDAKLEARATLRYADGEQVELALEQGHFRIAGAGTLPTGARTPTQALADLRRALSRRSYAALLRVLSTESQSAIEGDMRSLVEGLDRPETLDVQVKGDRAEVRIPGGHRVMLKRESGVWRVEDFD